MDLPIVSGDSQLLQILTAHADDLLAERHSVTALQSMVANQLASLLPSGESRAAMVARQLGMSHAVVNPAPGGGGDDLRRNLRAATTTPCVSLPGG